MKTKLEILNILEQNPCNWDSDDLEYIKEYVSKFEDTDTIDKIFVDLDISYRRDWVDVVGDSEYIFCEDYTHDELAQWLEDELNEQISNKKLIIPSVVKFSCKHIGGDDIKIKLLDELGDCVNEIIISIELLNNGYYFEYKFFNKAEDLINEAYKSVISTCAYKIISTKFRDSFGNFLRKHSDTT